MQGRKFFFYLWSIAFILPIFSLQAQDETQGQSIDYAEETVINDIIEKAEDVPIRDKIENMSGRETRELAFFKLREAQDNYKNIKKTTRTFYIQRIKVEKKIESLKKSKNKDGKKLQNLKNEVKFLKKSEKHSKKLEKVAGKTVDERKEIIDLDEEKRKKMLLKLYPVQKNFQAIKSMDSIVLKDKKKKKEKENKDIVINEKKTQKIETQKPKKTPKEKPKSSKSEKKTEKTKTPTSDESIASQSIAKKKIEEKESKQNGQEKSISNTPKKIFATYKASEDVTINPPARPCSFSFSGEDELTGKTRKDVQAQLLFAQTDESLRLYMNGKEYLTCHGYLTSLAGGFQFLTLDIVIASKNAQKEYGLIKKGSTLTIITLDGKEIRLQATKSDIGKYDKSKEAFVYKVSYRISGSNSKQLKKSEIDIIRLVWSSGYVDYNIYEVDFFINQFDCLTN